MISAPRPISPAHRGRGDQPGRQGRRHKVRAARPAPPTARQDRSGYWSIATVDKALRQPRLEALILALGHRAPRSAARIARPDRRAAHNAAAWWAPPPHQPPAPRPGQQKADHGLLGRGDAQPDARQPRTGSPARRRWRREQDNSPAARHGFPARPPAWRRSRCPGIAGRSAMAFERRWRSARAPRSGTSKPRPMPAWWL